MLVQGNFCINYAVSRSIVVMGGGVAKWFKGARLDSYPDVSGSSSALTT